MQEGFKLSLINWVDFWNEIWPCSVLKTETVQSHLNLLDNKFDKNV